MNVSSPPPTSTPHAVVGVGGGLGLISDGGQLQQASPIAGVMRAADWVLQQSGLF